jgi:hypothetical protein
MVEGKLDELPLYSSRKSSFGEIVYNLLKGVNIKFKKMRFFAGEYPAMNCGAKYQCKPF